MRHIIGKCAEWDEIMIIDGDWVDFYQIDPIGNKHDEFCMSRDEAIAAARAILAHFGESV